MRIFDFNTVFRTQFDRLRQDFIIQVSNGNIGIYFSNFGEKAELVMELIDERIQKSLLNTLVASGGHGGFGTMRIRGIISQGQK